MSDVVVNVKLRLISHLVLVYSLLTLNLLLFYKICSVAQVLSLLHMHQQTGRKQSLINVHFKFYVQGNCYMELQYIFSKSQNYNTTMSRQEKRQRAKKEFKEVLDKK